MTPNDEIVKLATEWAILQRDARAVLTSRLDEIAARILVLTAPPERKPMPWPGKPGWTVKVTDTGLGWFVLVRNQAGSVQWSGPICSTPDAAIDAWDEVMMRLAGTGLSAKHQRWIRNAIECLRWERWCVHANDLQAILDAHPDGGGA